jgi:hypothetical protein
MSGINPTPASLPGRTVNYPKDITQVQQRADEREFENWGTMAGLGTGAVALGVAGGVVGRMLHYTGGYNNEVHVLTGWGIAGGVFAGAALGGLLGYMYLSPKWNAHRVDKAMEWDAQSRPPIPSSDKAPTVDISSIHGKFVPGVSGSNIGNVVKLHEKQLSNVITTSHVTNNTNGEPTIVIGQPSGSQSSTSTLVDVVPGYLNAMGLGRVLYNTNGYKTMDEAINAYDGNHSVAIVKQDNKYYIADFDAQRWEDISDPSKAMVVSDDRVKAILTNYNMYVPSNIGTKTGDKGVDSGGRVFMFAQEQDNDTSVPLGVRDLTGRSIGWYDTNGRSRDRGPLHGSRLVDVGSSQIDGKPVVFTDFQEAAAKMEELQGLQGMVKSGDRYYLVELDRTKDLTEVTAQDRTAYILGLRTMPDAQNFALIEDEGGLYAPVGDWFIQARDAK